MIKVNIWYPRNTVLDTAVDWLFADHLRWGHCGLKFMLMPGRANTYFTFWPGDGADWSQPAAGRVIRSRQFDIRGEGSEPDQVVVLNGLDEAAMFEYWERLERTHTYYYYAGFNCCEAVAQSIMIGLGEPFADYQPSTCLYLLPRVCQELSSPRQLELWLQQYVLPRLNQRCLEASREPDRLPTMRAPLPMDARCRSDVLRPR